MAYGTDANFIVRSAVKELAELKERTKTGLIMDILVQISKRLYPNIENIELWDEFRSKNGLTSVDINWYLTHTDRDKDSDKIKKVEELIRFLGKNHERAPGSSGYYGMWGFERKFGRRAWPPKATVRVKDYTETRLNLL